ncbi:hypothetical protein RVR_P152 (plasmid) [Actinacidiphila reveromycinica]|uniref:Uncharacterized protein n=1 Tax=Actinacidiphila reveromycinica TaxID=659352 RepID=A0A7R6TAB6_9ACTN|nr:hypothetical protein [Streptomyces sp. SN-593]BBG20675.1 hypothetical protein RVR_P152 [Streptomyces sp. SN-593]
MAESEAEPYAADLALLTSASRTSRLLREAGERAADAEAARRAAIAAMGHALLGHRSVQQHHAGTRAGVIELTTAATWAGVTRRTLYTAMEQAPAEPTDQDLARAYRHHRYDLAQGGSELHRRYPRLAGVHDAYQYLRRQLQHDDPADAAALLWREYERQVTAIAERQPLTGPAGEES